MWRAIVDVLKLGLIGRIGNDLETNIWEDNWILRDEMMKPYGCLANNPPVTVSEIIDATATTRNFQRIQEVFLPIDVPSIVSIPLCTRNILDTWQGISKETTSSRLDRHTKC